MRFRGGIAKKVGGIGAPVVIVNQSVTFLRVVLSKKGVVPPKITCPILRVFPQRG